MANLREVTSVMLTTKVLAATGFSQTDSVETLSEEIIAKRKGQVLHKNTILKADHFPGCQNKTLVPSFEDAPNFRQMQELPIFGVAIPTIAGLRIVLDILTAKTQKVLWHNLREEPLLYINGNPYVVRDADKPFANLEYTGIDVHRVEAMEERLKQDVLQEMLANDGRVVLSGESDDAKVIQHWEDVTADAIQTPQDVFRHLVHHHGYNVDYLRVPVTDEKAPKEVDCDVLVQRCWEPGENTSLVFNCQMGRGRTTTGMIIAALLHLRRHGCFPLNTSPTWMPEWFRTGMDAARSARKGPLESGFYGVVRSLLRVLEFGVDAKNVADVVIDAADQMQNLRGAIYKYRERLCQEQDERGRNALLRVALEYLERYTVLIAFTAYLSRPEFQPNSCQHVTFEKFMNSRPEFKSVLKRMLRRNPVSALSLRVSNDDEEEPKLTNSHLFDGEPASPPSSYRLGRVLGQCTILKEDQFPGIEDRRVQQVIEGAPNFRGVPELPIYGVGMPTIAGIRNVLSSIGSGLEAVEGATTTLWFNWREEPLVYINGRPFVLREENRPFKNLKEYSNIDRIQLEKMENRLKQDVLQEAAEREGWIAVALETPQPSEEYGILDDGWERIDGVSSVQTPADVYDSLREEGFAVEYYRIPLTDGRTPDVVDIDEILKRMEKEPLASSIVFNCQNGVDRATMGMIIASLAFTHSHSTTRCSPVVSSLSDVSHLCLTHPSWKQGDSEEDGSTKDSESDDVAGVEEWRDGAFLAIRKITHLLHHGPAVESLLDSHVDECDLLVNIKAEIGQFRKGRRKPEISHRDAAFNRGVSYLHSYCFLLAVTAYISSTREQSKLSFSKWMASRSDIVSALDSILLNPTAALTVLVPRASPRDAIDCHDAVSAEEEAQFLRQRNFKVLNVRSILKGARPLAHEAFSSVVPDCKSVRHKHIYTVGDPSVKTLRMLLDQVTSEDASKKSIVIRDIREELVVYINGIPYTRRDLERPVNSLHHAEASVEDIERLEEILREDVRKEAKLHSGTVLLHHEVPACDSDDLRQGSQRLEQHRGGITHAVDESAPAVVPVWGHVEEDGCDEQSSVSTPGDIFKALAAEGYPLKHARVPLSRGRSPSASDLDLLAHETDQNEDSVYIIVSRAARGSSARYAAAFFSLVLSSDRHLTRRRSFSKDPSQSKFALGEYRSIMHLCRALSGGYLCKAAVDQAIDDCVNIGSLREDILSCMYAVDSDPHTVQLGIHYLKRYFFLIAYRCFCDQHRGESFEEWMADRKELCHLLKVIKLE